jgi:hypothetical protein
MKQFKNKWETAVPHLEYWIKYFHIITINHYSVSSYHHDLATTV